MLRPMSAKRSSAEAVGINPRGDTSVAECLGTPLPKHM
jgi:hypothetical protein